MYKPTKYRRGNRTYGSTNRRYPTPRNMGSQITVLNGVGPVASKLITTVKYCESYFQSTAGVGFNQFFNLNSLFDPDRSGIGHQPYGFDQLSNLYSRYRVFRTRWHINAKSDQDLLNMCVIPLNHASIAANFSGAMEQPRAVTKTVTGSSAGDATQFYGSIYLPELTGETSEQYRTNEDNQAQTTASPGTLLTLRITTDCPTGATFNLLYNITLEFDCEFFDPVALAQS